MPDPLEILNTAGLGYYTLDEHGNPVRCDSLIEWGRQFEQSNRVVAHNTVNGVLLSTVFLGLDHGYGCGAPILWETMVFGGAMDQEQWRYTSQDDARDNHLQILKRLRKRCAKRSRSAADQQAFGTWLHGTDFALFTLDTQKLLAPATR